MNSMLVETGLIGQLLVVAVIAVVTIWATNRGLQNGLLLLLISGMTSVWLIKSPTLPNLSFDRLVWPLVLLVFFFKWRQGQVRKLPLDWVEYSMLAVLVIIGASMYIHGSYTTQLSSLEYAGEEALRLNAVSKGFIIPFSTYFLARRGIVTQEQMRSFFIGVALITLYLGITGMAEAGGVHWLVFPKYILDPNVGIHYGHVRGPFVNAAYNGTAMAMALPLLAWLALNDHTIRGRLLGWGTIVIVIAVMPFVLQRAVWLGAAGALAMMAMVGSKQRVLLTGLIVLISAAGLLALPDNLAARLEAKINKTSTIDFRLQLAKTSWEIIQDHPLTGIGFLKFDEGVEEYSDGEGGGASHNTVLTLAVEVGLLGILPYLAIFVLFALESFHAYLTQPRYRLIIGVLWGTTVAYSIQLVSGELRYIIYLNALFFTLWGIVLEATREQRRVLNVRDARVATVEKRYGQSTPQYAVWA